MKIKFNIEKEKNISLAKLLADVSAFKCRLKFDLNEGLIVTELKNSNDVESIIDIISNYFNILSSEIENTDIVEVAPEANKFDNSELNIEFEKLSRMLLQNEKNGGDISTIVREIKTLNTEMELNVKDEATVLSFNEGDIVDVFYGCHINGEAIGDNGYALVLKYYPKTAILVPLSSTVKQEIQDQFIIKEGRDFVYTEDASFRSFQRSIIWRMTKNLSKKRILKVVGHVSEEAYGRVVSYVAKKFHFKGETSLVPEVKVKADVNKKTEDKKSKPEDKISNKSLITEFLMKKFNNGECVFSVDELRKQFPEMSPSNISNFVYRAKNDKFIVSIGRGEYKIINLD